MRMFLTMAAGLGLIVAPALAREPGPAEDVPELKALAGFVGKFDTMFKVKPLEGASEGIDRKGTAEGEWILGGRFLRQTWSVEAADSAPAVSGWTIMTYDVEKKTYRSWHFVSEGGASEGEGAYDAGTKTLTWTARDARGLKTVTRSSMVEDGESWAITVSDPEGKVLVDLKGKNTRRTK